LSVEDRKVITDLKLDFLKRSQQIEQEKQEEQKQQKGVDVSKNIDATQDAALMEITLDASGFDGLTRSSLSLPEVVGFENLFGNPASLYVAADGDSALVTATTDRDSACKIVLASDTETTFGAGTTEFRGWTFEKNPTTAELTLSYENNDTTGQILVPAYTIMQFDGLNNLVELPTAGTQLVFDTDTNLYRSAANTLKTDDNFIIGGLATTGVVHNNASGLLSTSLIVNADVDPAAGIVDTKLATISTAGKVSNSATTATSVNTPNAIIARNGSGNFSAGAASLTDAIINNLTVVNCVPNLCVTDLSVTDTSITGTVSVTDSIVQNETVTLLSATDAVVANLTVTNCMANLCVNDLSAVDQAVSGSLSVNDEVVDGSLTISPFSTAGVVHNDATGLLSSSLIVNADVSASAAIVDTKLATISTAGKVANSATTATSANTPNTIVLRNGSGNFSAGAVSLTDAVIGNLTVTNCVTSICLSSLSIVDAVVSGSLSVNDEVVNGTLTIPSFTPAGVVHNDASGLLSTSLIVNADVAPAAGIVDTKLATISTAGKVANSATTATSANTANTIVLRDGSGNFSAGTITANLTGSASNNVLKAGDTMTGTLAMATQNQIQFQDTSGGEYVGINAPSIVPTSYTISLPSTSPTAHQVLRANATTPTNLEWASEGGSALPAVARTIYVAKYGNDTTGDGSFNNPYLTVSKGIAIANTLSSNANPVAIQVNSGVYVENNSAGPLAITVAGVSIVGESVASVIIVPNTASNDLITANNSLRMANVTLKGSSSTATGLDLTTGALSTFNNMRFLNFQTGVACSGGAANSYGFSSCLFSDNGTAITVSDARVELNVCSIFGVGSLAGPAANTGISITGAGAGVLVSSGVIGVCANGLVLLDDSLTTLTGVSFKLNEFDINQSGASHLSAVACSFQLTTGSSDTDLTLSGAGTDTELVGCQFDGRDISGNPQGTCMSVTNEATVRVSGGSIVGYTTAIQLGTSLDTSSTVLQVNSLVINDCTNDIIQNGTTTLDFSASTASSTKITLNDSTNVNVAFFDLDDDNALTIGSLSNQSTVLLQAAIDPVNHPSIAYEPSIYSTEAIGYENLFGSPSTFFVEANNNAGLAAITTIRTDVAGLRLVSDTGSPVGGTSALRGWDVNKNGSSAELAFKYQNTDTVGQIAVPQYTLMQLDGLNDQLQLPTVGTKVVFATDTNLYRSSASVLKTDGNLIVGGLTAGRAVQTNASTNQLESSTVTNTELGYLSGVTSPIQTQINGKVAKAGDTMTGTLQLPAGTAALPSLVFTGSTTTGLSAAVADTLSFSTAATQRMTISPTGVVAINGFSTAGVVHNDASGNLSSSLIVNADITNATISNAKLATISSSNTPGSIVVRDGSGNFATNMITLLGSVTNPTDAATKSYVDSAVATGIVAKTPALVVSTTNVTISGLQTIDGVALSANDRVLLVGQTNPVENGLWLAQSGAWTRPADFANGTMAGQAYVLILSGATYEGSSWLCSTPTAVIGTDPIQFSLFSLPNTTTGANVGAGTGLVFRDKTGITLNFRSLLAGTHLTITTNTDDVTFTTDATSANTASTIVARDASGNFSAGTITANLTGSASNNVLKAGDTMTGTLQLPAGTAAAPSLVFTGSTTTGLSAAVANTLSFSTAGSQRMTISPTGVVAINGFSTAGVVHNDASGNLTSSLIVNADVDPAAGIVDTKLATISTAGKVSNSATTATSSNTPNTIVLRDGSGNFSAGTITASLTGSASNNVLKAGDTMTGTLQLPAGSAASPSLVFTGSTTSGLSASAGDLVFSTTGVDRFQITSGGTLNIPAFTSAGIVHNDASGDLSSSLIVNADVSPTAAIVDTKLATIATAGKVANSATTGTSLNSPNTLVLRDNTGSFAAQTISVVDEVVSGNISLSDTSSATVGNIVKAGTRFIHNFGTNNTFVGKNSGNFTMTGTGNNTGVGVSALTANTTGIQNTALGSSAGSAITTGSNNVMVGYSVGTSTTTGSNNVYIDGNALAPANESNTIRIGNTQTKSFMQGIFGVTVAGGTAVFVRANGQLGTTTSSKRFKHDIIQLGDMSEKIYDLNPVSFIYNDDENDALQYGLIAEEVDEVFPTLVVRDDNDAPYTVKYDVLPVLLLNELKKQKISMQQQRADINRLISAVNKLQKKVKSIARG